MLLYIHCCVILQNCEIKPVKEALACMQLRARILQLYSMHQMSESQNCNDTSSGFSTLVGLSKVLQSFPPHMAWFTIFNQRCTFDSTYFGSLESMYVENTGSDSSILLGYTVLDPILHFRQYLLGRSSSTAKTCSASIRIHRVLNLLSINVTTVLVPYIQHVNIGMAKVSQTDIKLTNGSRSTPRFSTNATFLA